MTPEDVVRQMWDAINARDLARVAGAIAEHCEWVSVPTEQTHIGPEAMVRGVRAFHETFADGRADIERLHAVGDVVVIEWRTSGTRTSDGRSFSRRGCSVAEVRGGKIAKYRDYFDRPTLDEQLNPPR
jgi:uncharacterized protein (TIGR02246 family)